MRRTDSLDGGNGAEKTVRPESGRSSRGQVS